MKVTTSEQIARVLGGAILGIFFLTGALVVSSFIAHQQIKTEIRNGHLARVEQGRRIANVEVALEFMAWRECRAMRREGLTVPDICTEIDMVFSR
jgi:hypothetical protein